MRVCIFSTTFFPQAGGAERFIHGLATHLTKKGIEVFVLVPFLKELEGFRPPYKILKIRNPINSTSFYEWILLVNLIFYHLIYRFDILQTVILYPPGYVGVKLKRFFPKIPVLCRPTGSDIQIVPEINYGLRLNKEIDKKVKTALKILDGLVANSPSIREELVKAGCNADKISIIPNGLDLKRFSRKATDVREQLSLAQDTKVILSVGRVHPKKDYETLLKAMKIVVEKCQRCYLVIVGGGEENLKALVSKLSLHGRVIFTGQISTQRVGDFSNYPSQSLLDIYLSSDLFVFSSLIEGQPNVLLEALAAGLPIVAANVPGSKDVVEDGKTGFLVAAKDENAFADKILRLLESKGLYKKMSTNAREEAKEYAFSKVSERYIKLYESVLGV